MKKDSGSTVLCGRGICQNEAVRCQGHQNLCEVHYRFGQMRVRAKRDGKAVPSHGHLVDLLFQLPLDFSCPHCKRVMKWMRDGNSSSSQVTLQHYRSGKFGLICLACNCRHAAMPADEFVDLSVSQKRCPGCKIIKDFSDFTTDSLGRWNNKKSYCKSCSHDRHRKWVVENKSKYNEYQRNYRLLRKQLGNPVRRSQKPDVLNFAHSTERDQ